MQQYWGPNKILSKEIAEGRDGMVTMKVLRDTDTKEEFEVVVSNKVFELCVTDEKKDWNYLWDTKLNALVEDMMIVAEQYGLTGGESEQFFKKFNMRLNTMFDRAVHILLNGTEVGFVPGGDVYFDVTVNKANAIIQANGNK